MLIYVYIPIITTLTLLFLHLIWTLKKDRLIENEILTPKEFIELYEDYNGYALCIESNMLLDEFNIYKKIHLTLKKVSKSKIITFDLSNKNYDENWELLEKITVTNIPSVFYIQKNSINKEIYKFTDRISKVDLKKIEEITKKINNA